MNWNVVNSSGDFSNRRFRADSDMSDEERARIAQMRREAGPRPPREQEIQCGGEIELQIVEGNVQTIHDIHQIMSEQAAESASGTAGNSAASNANNQSGNAQVVTNQDGDTFTPSNSATSQASSTSQASATSQAMSDFEQVRQQAHALNDSHRVHFEGRPSFILGDRAQKRSNAQRTLFELFHRMGIDNPGVAARELMAGLSNPNSRNAAIATIENLANQHLGSGQDTVQFLANVYALVEQKDMVEQGWHTPHWSTGGQVPPSRLWEVWTTDDNGNWIIMDRTHGRQFSQEERTAIVEEGNRVANQQQALRDLFASANLQFGTDFFSQLTSLLRNNGMQSTLDWTLSIMSTLNQPTVINPTS
jgi:hypothetical protein